VSFVTTYVPEVACVVDNGLSAGNSDRYLVSPQQECLWAAEPNGPSARTQAVLAIDGEVDTSAIADAERAEQLEGLREAELEASFDLETVRLMAELGDMSDEAAQRLLTQDLSTEAGQL